MEKANPVVHPHRISQNQVPAYSVVQGRHPLLPVRSHSEVGYSGGGQDEYHESTGMSHQVTISKVNRPFYHPIFYQVPTVPPTRLAKRLGQGDNPVPNMLYGCQGASRSQHHQQKISHSLGANQKHLAGGNTDPLSGMRFITEGIDQTSCAICEESFKHRHQMDDHFGRVHAPGDQALRCSYCTYMCFEEENMQSHMWRYHNKSFSKSELVPLRRPDSSQAAFMQSAEMMHQPKQQQVTPASESSTHCVPYSTPVKTEPDMGVFDDRTSLHTPVQSMCSTCGGPLPQAGKPADHVCFGRVIHCCALCSFTCYESVQMTAHIAEAFHKKTYIAFECTKCKKVYNNHWHLKMHVRKHIWVKPYKCDVCGRGFSEKWYLKSHLKTHKTKMIVPVSVSAAQTGPAHAQQKCPTSRPTTSSTALPVLMNQRESSFACQLCNKTFSNPHFLETHIMVYHPVVSQSAPAPKKSLPVIKCAIPSITNKDTKKPLSIDNLFPCPICRIIFMTEEERQKHLANYHKRGPTVQQVSENPASQAVHSTTAHSKPTEKPTSAVSTASNKGTESRKEGAAAPAQDKAKHKCSLCERKFAEVWHLRRHMTSHLGKAKNIKPSTSSVQAKPACAVTAESKPENRSGDPLPGKSTRTRKRKCTSLLESLEGRHGKKKKESVPSEGLMILKPHMCKVCDRTFAEWWNLKRHMQSHSKVEQDGDAAQSLPGDEAPKGKVKLCKLCPRSFSESWQQRRHMQSHRNDIGLMWMDLVMYSHASGTLFMPDTIGRGYSMDLLMHSQLKLKNLENASEVSDNGDGFGTSQAGASEFTTDVGARRYQGTVPGSQNSTPGVQPIGTNNSKDTYLSQLGLGEKSEKNHLRKSSFASTAEYSIVPINRAGLDPYTTLSQQTNLAEESGLLLRKEVKYVKTSTAVNEVEKMKPPSPKKDKKGNTVQKKRRAKKLAVPVKKEPKNDQLCMRLDMHYTFERSKFESDLKLTRQKDTGMYHCPFCEKNFHQPFHLKIHIRTHTADRPYSCKYCNYTGTQVASIRSHLKSKHKSLAFSTVFRKTPGTDATGNEGESSLEEEAKSTGEASVGRKKTPGKNTKRAPSLKVPVSARGNSKVPDHAPVKQDCHGLTPMNMTGQADVSKQGSHKDILRDLLSRTSEIKSQIDDMHTSPSIGQSAEMLPCESRPAIYPTYVPGQVNWDENNNIPRPLDLATSKKTVPQLAPMVVGRFDPYHIENTFQAHIGNRHNYPVTSHHFFRDIYESHANVIKSMHLEPLDLSMSKTRPQASPYQALILDLSVDHSAPSVKDDSGEAKRQDGTCVGTTETCESQGSFRANEQHAKYIPPVSSQSETGCIRQKSTYVDMGTDGQNSIHHQLQFMNDPPNRDSQFAGGNCIYEQSDSDITLFPVGESSTQSHLSTHRYRQTSGGNFVKSEYGSEKTVPVVATDSAVCENDVGGDDHGNNPTDCKVARIAESTRPMPSLSTTGRSDAPPLTSEHDGKCKPPDTEMYVEGTCEVKDQYDASMLPRDGDLYSREEMIPAYEYGSDDMNRMDRETDELFNQAIGSYDVTDLHEDSDLDMLPVHREKSEDVNAKEVDQGDDEILSGDCDLIMSHQDGNSKSCGEIMSVNESEIPTVQRMEEGDGRITPEVNGRNDKPLVDIQSCDEDMEEISTFGGVPVSEIYSYDDDVEIPGKLIIDDGFEDEDGRNYGAALGSEHCPAAEDYTGRLHRNSVIEDLPSCGENDKEVDDHEKSKEEKNVHKESLLPLEDKYRYAIEQTQSSELGDDLSDFVFSGANQIHPLGCLDEIGSNIESAASNRTMPSTPVGVKRPVDFDTVDMDAALTDLLMVDKTDDIEGMPSVGIISDARCIDIESESRMQECREGTRTTMVTATQSNQVRVVDCHSGDLFSQQTSHSRCTGVLPSSELPGDTEPLGNLQELVKVISLSSRCMSSVGKVLSEGPSVWHPQQVHTFVPSCCSKIDALVKRFTPQPIPGPQVCLPPAADSSRARPAAATASTRRRKRARSQSAPVKIAPKPQVCFFSIPAREQDQQAAGVIPPPFKLWPPPAVSRISIASSCAHTVTYTQNTNQSSAENIHIIWSRSTPDRKLDQDAHKAVLSRFDIAESLNRRTRKSKSISRENLTESTCSEGKSDTGMDLNASARATEKYTSGCKTKSNKSESEFAASQANTQQVDSLTPPFCTTVSQVLPISTTSITPTTSPTLDASASASSIRTACVSTSASAAEASQPSEHISQDSPGTLVIDVEPETTGEEFGRDAISGRVDCTSDEATTAPWVLENSGQVGSSTDVLACEEAKEEEREGETGDVVSMAMEISEIGENSAKPVGCARQADGTQETVTDDNFSKSGYSSAISVTSHAETPGSGYKNCLLVGEAGGQKNNSTVGAKLRTETEDSSPSHSTNTPLYSGSFIHQDEKMTEVDSGSKSLDVPVDKSETFLTGSPKILSPKSQSRQMLSTIPRMHESDYHQTSQHLPGKFCSSPEVAKLTPLGVPVARSKKHRRKRRKKEKRIKKKEGYKEVKQWLLSLPDDDTEPLSKKPKTEEGDFIAGQIDKTSCSFLSELSSSQAYVKRMSIDLNDPTDAGRVVMQEAGDEGSGSNLSGVAVRTFEIVDHSSRSHSAEDDGQWMDSVHPTIEVQAGGAQVGKLQPQVETTPYSSDATVKDGQHHAWGPLHCFEDGSASTKMSSKRSRETPNTETGEGSHGQELQSCCSSSSVQYVVSSMPRQDDSGLDRSTSNRKVPPLKISLKNTPAVATDTKESAPLKSVVKTDKAGCELGTIKLRRQSSEWSVSTKTPPRAVFDFGGTGGDGGHVKSGVGDVHCKIPLRSSVTPVQKVEKSRMYRMKCATVGGHKRKTDGSKLHFRTPCTGTVLQKSVTGPPHYTGVSTCLRTEGIQRCSVVLDGRFCTEPPKVRRIISPANLPDHPGHKQGIFQKSSRFLEEKKLQERDGKGGEMQLRFSRVATAEHAQNPTANTAGISNNDWIIESAKYQPFVQLTPFSFDSDCQPAANVEGQKSSRNKQPNAAKEASHKSLKSGAVATKSTVHHTGSTTASHGNSPISCHGDSPISCHGNSPRSSKENSPRSS